MSTSQELENQKEILYVLKEKSYEILNQQMATKNNLQSNAGILIGFIGIFFSLFIFVIDKSSICIKIASILPLIGSIFGLLKLFQILKINRTNVGYEEKVIPRLLASRKLNYVISYDVASNIKAIEKNNALINTLERNYNQSITAILASFILATLLLFLSIFVNIDTTKMENNKPTKQVIINNEISKEVEEGYILPEIPDEDIKVTNDEIIKKKVEKKKPYDKK